jgi:hypothetical protein
MTEPNMGDTVELLDFRKLTPHIRLSCYHRAMARMIGKQVTLETPRGCFNCGESYFHVDCYPWPVKAMRRVA